MNSIHYIFRLIFVSILCPSVNVIFNPFVHALMALICDLSINKAAILNAIESLSESAFNCQQPSSNSMHFLTKLAHTMLYFLLVDYNYMMCLLLLQDEISFQLDVPLAGDSVDEETGTHDVMMTVPPNQVHRCDLSCLCYEFA